LQTREQSLGFLDVPIGDGRLEALDNDFGSVERINRASENVSITERHDSAGATANAAQDMA
jgi:hypothetical protein